MSPPIRHCSTTRLGKSTFTVRIGHCVLYPVLMDREDLQKLQWLSGVFAQAIMSSTRRMPYPMRLLAREILAALRVSLRAC